MHPILFTIGKTNFYSYGFFASLAFIAGYMVVHLIYQKEKQPTENLIDKILLVFIVGIIVSRLAFFIIYRDLFSSWWQVFYIWQGGLISYGGLVGGLATYILLFRKKLLHNLDILALAFLIGDFFWRIGCTFAGDHPTIATSSWLAINSHVPAPLLEGIGGLFGFVVFLIVYQKTRLKNGLLFSMIIFYYGLIRLIVDHWRIDSMVGNLTNGQFTGMVMMILGAIAILSMILYDKFAAKIHN